MKSPVRIIALVFGLIVGAFYVLMALDSVPKGFNRDEVLGFLIHLVPGIIVITCTLVSFWYRRAGFWIFILLAASVTVYFKTYTELQRFMLLTLPMLTIALLLLPGYGNKDNNKQ
ncbi:MAG: hypothetical protein U0X39_13100 [Bacteroidales bacterium]